MNGGMTRPAPAENFRLPCGCDGRALFRPGRTVYASYHTAIPALGLCVTTWWQDRGDGDDSATAISRAVNLPCRLCGKPYWAPFADIDIVWRQTYPADRVTVAGLGEAHEAIMAQVLAGRLP